LKPTVRFWTGTFWSRQTILSNFSNCIRMESQAEIKWPERFDPNRTAVHVRNELTMDAPCDSVWAWLVRAESWPSWYLNSSKVRFLEGPPPDLKLGTRFKWKTFGIGLVSTVLEFVPNERLAWDAKGPGVEAYHVWLLQRTDSGCRVVTEETQIGFMARLQNRFRPDRMHEQHQKWLEGLEAKARAVRP
jgi:hypothetical protein